MKKIKFGILTAGYIADIMARTMNPMEEVECVAIASRDISKAQALADKHNIKKVYGSYEDLVNDDEIDAIYVASPNTYHYEHAKLCINHGKHILCEKPFAINEKQTKEVLDLAKEKNVSVLDGIWVRYLPYINELKKVLESGEIGEVTNVYASFGSNSIHKDRMSKPELGGGVLLDLTIYPLSFVDAVFGDDIEKIVTSCTKTENGLDKNEVITMTYKSGLIATVSGNMTAKIQADAIIYGREGKIIIPQFWEGSRFFVYKPTEPQPYKVVDCPHDFTGYEFEVRRLCQIINEGKIECEEMPHSKSLYMARMLDGFRKEWGVKYPGE